MPRLVVKHISVHLGGHFWEISILISKGSPHQYGQASPYPLKMRKKSKGKMNSLCVLEQEYPLLPMDIRTPGSPAF
jgi:hypothetical protein